MQDAVLSSTILSHLLLDEKYGPKVYPILKASYFQDTAKQKIFECVHDFHAKYNAFPNQEALLIDLSNRKDMGEDAFEQAKEIVLSLDIDETTDHQWLLDNTVQFCREAAIADALMAGYESLEKKSKVSTGAIPKMLEEALAISLDNNIGHDYWNDVDKQWEFYSEKVTKYPFDIELLNKITDGGIEPKALFMYMAGTGIGKTHIMCHNAAAHLMMGYNVLYLTMEMRQERIRQRIDQNLLDTDQYSFKKMTKDQYIARVSNVHQKTQGRLKVKEYPTGSCTADMVRQLLKDYKLKDKFVPHIIYVDYIGLCASTRFKGVKDANSNTLIKACAEEFRGLGMELDVAVVSATQVNRGGINNSEVELEDISESIGLTFTADVILALTVDEDLQAKEQMAVKQLKNRWGDPYNPRKFYVGMDRKKMRMYDVEQHVNDIEDEDDQPVFDKTEVMKDERPGVITTPFKKKFSGFK